MAPRNDVTTRTSAVTKTVLIPYVFEMEMLKKGQRRGDSERSMDAKEEKSCDVETRELLLRSPQLSFGNAKLVYHRRKKKGPGGLRTSSPTFSLVFERSRPR